MNRRSAFSLMEISIILIAIALLLTIVVSSLDLVKAAKLNNARNLTKTSIAKDTPGMILWLDSIAVKSFDNEKIKDGDEIINWNDLNISDQDPYIASSVATKRPLYDEDAINDFPGVKYDGTDDYMQITDFTANSYMTLFVVGKFDNTADSFWIEHGPTISSSDGFYFYGYGSAPTGMKRSATLLNNDGNTNWFGGSTAIGIMRYNNTTISYKKHDDTNFTDKTVSNLGNISLKETLNIGARNATTTFANKGSFGEIIMYDRALSNDEVDDIVEYLKSKWEIE